ncbi:Hypothetical protein, putative [Bodo saltans]|uniref:Plant heme peroxidase family profile domain-containing protein n=1 Tax=Bodo saltans TaxID=75058 RepID=A0A0S4JPM4_BODSA|nr:Hypothetical protein, putative [Bodo saltans]|eukprot:CUG91028.1 Hypothetical protein, putative [Bodo saltans]
MSVVLLDSKCFAHIADLFLTVNETILLQQLATFACFSLQSNRLTRAFHMFHRCVARQHSTRLSSTQHLRLSLTASTCMSSASTSSSSMTSSVSPLHISARYEFNMANETTQQRIGTTFKAPPNVGPGRQKGQEANPFKSWEHMSHKWLIMMCVGCLGGGYAAGQLAEVDESQIQPKFDRAAAVADLWKTFEFRPDLAPTALRVAFVLAARRGGVSATSVDESCAVVSGLEDIAGVYNFIAGRHQMSMEDITSLTAVVAVRFLRGPSAQLETNWKWGRDDKDKAIPRQPVPQGREHHSVLAIMKHIGDLTDEEGVALLGIHAVGELHPTVSGVLDGAKNVPGRGFTLDNKYFQFILETEKQWKPLEVARTQENKETVKELPKTFRCVYASAAATSSSSSPAAGEALKDTPKKSKKKDLCVANGSMLDYLLKRKESRQWVEVFAKDKTKWENAFERGLEKMLESNFKKLRVFHNNNNGGSAPLTNGAATVEGQAAFPARVA